MTFDSMERRKFIKRLSSMCVGFMTSRLWNTPFSFAATQKTPSVEYRTLGKTGLKVTAVSMGVMNCSDPAVLLRAFDLGINFYDTADCYMGGRNEEMVGKAFQGKRTRSTSRRKSTPMMKRGCRPLSNEVFGGSGRTTSMFWFGTVMIRQMRFQTESCSISWRK